ncbi:MAG: MFS transporter [Labedaea sp.]
MTITPEVLDTARPPAGPAAEPGRGRWLMLTVLLAGQFMALLDVTIVNVAMPTMRIDLHASGSALQLIVAGYTVSYAMLLITGARLGELFGRRRMFLSGLFVFALSSLLCGLAPDVTTLIVARFLQGAGAALMVPQIMSMIQIRFTGAARATALSAYSAVIAVGAICGSILGGVLVDADLFGTGWRPVFLVNVPFALIVAVLVPRLVTPDGPRGTRKLDIAGLLVAVPAVFLMVFPVVLGHEQGWPAWTFLCLAAGLVLAAAFVAVERRVAARGGDPLLRLDVLRSPGLRSGLAAVGAGMIAYGGFLFIFTLHLQGGLGDSPLRASLTFAPAGAVFGLFGFYWRKLPGRIHHLLTPVGFTLAVLAYLAIAATMRDGGPGGALLQAGLLLFGASMGVAFSSLLTNALVHVPLRQAADASGLVTTTVQLAQVIGVATFGSLFLALAEHTGPHPSASALASVLIGLAGTLAAGILAAVLLTRTVLMARAA